MLTVCNYLKAARLALQLYQSRHTDRVYAFNKAHSYLEEALNHSMEHLWLNASLYDIRDELEAGKSDMRPVNAIIILIDELLKELESVIV